MTSIGQSGIGETRSGCLLLLFPGDWVRGQGSRKSILQRMVKPADWWTPHKLFRAGLSRSPATPLG